MHISIHALLAESDQCRSRKTGRPLLISIHALLAESDAYGRINDISRLIFLSTLSLRRATIHKAPYTNFHDIFLSTLSLRRATAKATTLKTTMQFLSTLSLRRATYNLNLPSKPIDNFYPRSPCGERLMDTLILANAMLFLSTLSLRRATAKVHKTVGHFCAYGTNFMGIASSC